MALNTLISDDDVKVIGMEEVVSLTQDRGFLKSKVCPEPSIAGTQTVFTGTKGRWKFRGKKRRPEKDLGKLTTVFAHSSEASPEGPKE